MNVDDVTASNYINIDTRIKIAGMIDDEEIIAAIQEAPEGEEEMTSTPISHTVALDSIQNLFNYLEQNFDIKINNSTISGMRDLLEESKMLL